MNTYCVKCKTNTGNKDIIVKEDKKGKNYYSSVCLACDTKKSTYKRIGLRSRGPCQGRS